MWMHLALVQLADALGAGHDVHDLSQSRGLPPLCVLPTQS